MVVCPACRSSNSPKSRFCVGCGVKLGEESTATTQQAAEEMETLPEGTPEHVIPPPIPASPDPVPPPPQPQIVSAPPVPPAPPVPDPPSVPATEVIREWEPVPRPMAAPLSRTDEDTPEECPLAIGLNFNRVFVAENASTFGIEVENCSPFAVENVEVVLESPRTLPQPLRLAFKRLAPGQKHHRLLEIDPERPGNFVLQTGVTLETRGEQISLLATRALKVNAIPDANIVINISDIQSNRHGGSNAALGAEYGDVNISNLVDSKAIRTLNDLIELELPDIFEPLQLELDYQLSLRSLTVAEKGLDNPVSIPRTFLHLSSPGSCLILTPVNGGEDALKLVSRPQFRLGRSRAETDLLTWFWPRSAANDEKTKRISKVQIIAAVQGDTISLQDAGSANGSTYNGTSLGAEKSVAVERRAILDLASGYTLDVMHFPSRFATRSPVITNIRNWSGPEETTGPRLGAMRFLPTSSESPPFRAVWMLSDAEFGTSHSNPIIFDDANLAEIQGRFFHFRGCFWIENAIPNQAIAINDQILDASSVAPLADGLRLRLGMEEFRISITD